MLDSEVGRIKIQYYPRTWRLNLSHNEKPVQDAALEAEKMPGWNVCRQCFGAAVSRMRH